MGELLGLSPIKIDYLLTGYLGRATGFVTVKPGIYNPLKTMEREYYFTAGRKVQQFYDLKEKNDQDYGDFKNMRREFTKEEAIDILEKKEKIALVYNALGLYREIDIEKNLEASVKLRDTILKIIDTF
jgi:hypothetical protein